jgi:hypothetical protein
VRCWRNNGGLNSKPRLSQVADTPVRDALTKLDIIEGQRMTILPASASVVMTRISGGLRVPTLRADTSHRQTLHRGRPSPTFTLRPSCSLSRRVAEDPVNQQLTWFVPRAPPAQPLIWRLLSHTAGLLPYQGCATVSLS